MGRIVSSDVQDLLNLRSCNTQTTVDIYPIAKSSYHYATDAFTIGDVEYQRHLRTTDPLRQSIAGVTNRVRVTIQNVDKSIGEKITDEDLTNAGVVLGRFFRNEQTVKTAPNDGHWTELFQGKAIPIEINENHAIFEILDDLTAAGYCVANWTLADNCQFAYKHLGTCGYTGDEDLCNKKRKSKYGCAGRENEYRFGGMEYPDPQSPVPPIGGGPSGPPGGGFPTCPKHDQLVLVRGEDEFSRVLRPARNVRVDNYVWNPIHSFWDRVTMVEIIEDQEIWRAVSANGGRGESSGTHPLISSPADVNGLAIAKCKPGRDQLTWSNSLLVPSTLTTVINTKKRDTVVRIETETGHIFCYGSTPATLIVGHNSIKPPEPFPQV